MTVYRVVISPTVQQRIAEYRDYIAVQSGSLSQANRWANHVFDKIASLETMPHCHEVAQENGSRPYEIRRMLIGRYVVNYTIREAETEVRVLGFRHGSRLPRVGDLPADPLA